MVTYEMTEKEINEAIDAALKEVKDKISEEMLPLMKEAAFKIQMENIPPYEAMGISKEIIEEMYAQGYHFFQSGKFKDALGHFIIVNQLSGCSDPRFLFSIAATHHQMKNYQKAAGFYMFYETLHPTDPLPYYYLYDCFKNLNEPEMAIKSLRGAARLAGKIPKYAPLKARIDLELQNSLDSTSKG